MKNIEIYFVGGTSSQWIGIETQALANMLNWLNNKKNTRIYEANFSDKKCYLRKENILFINVLD